MANNENMTLTEMVMKEFLSIHAENIKNLCGMLQKLDKICKKSLKNIYFLLDPRLGGSSFYKSLDSLFALNSWIYFLLNSWIHFLLNPRIHF